MAAMTTALTEFNDSLNSRSYFYTGHTALRPKLVLQKRRTPVGDQGVLEDTITILEATEDADGNLLPSKVSASVIFRRPQQGQAAEIANVKAILRDIVAGDEFNDVVDQQAYLT